MRAQIKQWGNSAAVRLPMAVLAAMKLDINSEVELQERGGELVLSPIKDDYRLESLLDGITSENQHEEISFGHPVGQELL